MEHLSYRPQAGTIGARAVAHFATLQAGAELANSVLAEALAVDPNILTPCLQSTVRHGLLSRTKREGRIYWGAGDAAAMARLPRGSGGATDAEAPRIIPAATAEPLAGVTPQSWCSAAPAFEAECPLDESSVAPPIPPAPQPQGLGWKAPRVPVFKRDAEPANTASAAECETTSGLRVHRPRTIAAESGADFSATPTASDDAATAVSAVASHAATSVPRPLRVALWSDGQLVIERASERIEFAKHETRQIVAYLERMAESTT